MHQEQFGVQYLAQGHFDLQNPIRTRLDGNVHLWLYYIKQRTFGGWTYKDNEPPRCEQGLNLRGETPLDFKSNALTTRPSQLVPLGLL